MGAGGGGNTTVGGSGGGAIALSGDQSVTVSGTITANGQQPGDQYAAPGGGAGGGILLKSQEGAVTISGTVCANGGNGAADRSFGGSMAGGGGGGGGGGRIKMFHCGGCNTDGATITVTGGAGGSQYQTPEPGMDGTIETITLIANAGTMISPAIDFDCVPGPTNWSQLLFTHNTNNGTITYDVQYWDGDSWKNTVITNKSTSPVDISSLEPAICNRIRIKANLAITTNTPYLLDWSVTWGEPPLVDLVVTSAYGAASPPLGTHTMTAGTEVTCTVEGEFYESSMATQYFCRGWTGTGSVPPTGTGTNTYSFALTDDSSITWNWQTNYWLEVQTNGNGEVSGGNRWVAENSSATVTATAMEHYHFVNWSGDISSTNNPLEFTMEQPCTVTAGFAVNMATNDVPETWLAAHYPDTNLYDNAAMSDTDTDGALAWEEYYSGTDPTNALSVLKIIQIRPGASNIGIYWSSVTGKFYSVYKCTNRPGIWPESVITSDVPGDLSGTNICPAPNDTDTRAYYRIGVQ